MFSSSSVNGPGLKKEEGSWCHGRIHCLQVENEKRLFELGSRLIRDEAVLQRLLDGVSKGRRCQECLKKESQHSQENLDSGFL